MVVNTTPPDSTASLAAQIRPVRRLCSGGWRNNSWQRAERAEKLIVKIVAVR